jgi:prevent-host-death family protein
LTEFGSRRYARDVSAKPTKSVNLPEAKTQLSRLVEDAARGEQIISAKNGVPRAMLVPVPKPKAARKPARALRVTYLSPDFDAPDPSIAALFEGDVAEA